MLNVLNPYKNEMDISVNLGQYAKFISIGTHIGTINIPNSICIPCEEISSCFDETTKASIETTITNFKNGSISIQQASQTLIELVNNVEFSRESLQNLGIGVNQCFPNAKDATFVVKNSIIWNDLSGKDLISDDNVSSCINVSYVSLADAILYMYSNIYSEFVLSKIQQSQFALDIPICNIIIQRMLASDVEGVIYPYNFVDGILNEKLIIAKIGRNIETDEDIEEYYHCFDANSYCADGRSEYELLTQEQISILMSQFQTISNEMLHNPNIFVKFIIEDDIVYITNSSYYSRPIPNPQRIWDGDSINKRKTNVLTPLSYSLFSSQENCLNKNLLSILYETPEIYESNREMIDNNITLFKDCAYYDTNKIYNLLMILPNQETNIPIWAKNTLIPNMQIETIPPRGNIPLLKGKSKKLEKSLDKSANAIFSHMLQEFQAFDSQYNNKQLTYQDLQALYTRLTNNVLVPLSYKKVNQLLLDNEVNELREKLAKINPDRNFVEYIIQTLLNQNKTPIGKDFEEMAQMVKNNNGILNVLQQFQNPNDVWNFMNTPNDLTNKMKEFFTKYGDFGITYDKIEELSYNENPLSFVQQIIEWQQRPTILDLQKDPNFKKVLEKKHIQDSIEQIDKYNFNQKMFEMTESMLNAKERKIFMYIGYIFAQEHILENQYDIVFMTLQEIFVNKTITQEIIEERKQQYDLNSNVPTFHKIIFDKER